MYTSLSLLATFGSLSYAAALPAFPQLEVRQSAASVNASLGNVTIFGTGMLMFIENINQLSNNS